MTKQLRQDSKLCPICGERITLKGWKSDFNPFLKADDRLLGSCGDAFTVSQWTDGDDDDFSPYEEAQFGAVLPDDPKIKKRASTQRIQLFYRMKGGSYWTLEELSSMTGIFVQSVSARLRDFRKPQYGGHTVVKKMLNEGVWQYKLIPRVKT